MKKPFLFLFAVVLITLLSTCSFLYPLNPWDDANVYMTIGNAMLGGKELYVDIFDHKGPVLFFLHEWAAMLSRSSFVGIYLLEIVCCYFYLLYSLRTMRLFAPSAVAVPLMCLLGVLTYSSDFFSYGDSVEEFALPIFAHSLYHMLRFVMDRQIPSRLQSFVMGVGVALLFWMKFNLLFFYAGGLLVLLFIAWRRSQTKEFWTIIWWAFLGFLAVTAGVLIYFAVHGTLGALWYAYFEVNIFHYHGVGTNGEPPFWWFKLVKLGIWAVLMIPVFFLRVSKEVKWLVFGTYGVLVLSYATLTVQFYYFLTLFPFFPLLASCFPQRLSKWACVVMSIVGLLAIATNWNVVTLVNGTFPTSVLEMADIINRNETEDSEVLTFSSYDTGIYQHTRHLPPNKNYFLSSILDPEIKAEQAELVASGKVKYLVREIGAINTCHEYYDAPIPANYRLIYDNEELFRYRFIWQPLSYLWN
ncbi:MAG: hypothetical protein J6T78_08260, partial [Bacteroidaceae bacterium]|nr:hypothetical protein [Bacteroidaceae bacterium]